MASRVVVVVRRCGELRIAVNYQYVNSYTVPDVTPLTCINEIIHQVGRAKYISVFDATAGYHQCLVTADHQWLTGFVSGSDFYVWYAFQRKYFR